MSHHPIENHQVKKIKESKLLKDIEQQQRTYGTIQQSDIEPREQKTSALTQLTEGAKDIYRRLSGRKKGQYAQLPTADPDFKSTLESSKREGQTQGTYAILPQEEMDFEAEFDAMNARRRAKNTQPRSETINLMDQIVNAPNPTWPAMQQFKTHNEKTIRKSIARTDQAEKEQRIKDGLATPTRAPRTPTRAPRTPKQEEAIKKFGNLIQKSSLKKKEKEFDETIQAAEPLIKRRILNNELKDLQKEMDDLLGKEKQLKTRAAKIGPLVQHESASQIQRAIRSKIARNKARNKAINQVEDQMTRVENRLSLTRSNLNEQRPEGLRKGLKKLQDRRSELVTRARAMNRDQKKAESKELNATIQHYEDVIDKKKPGPKTGKK